MPGKQQVGVPLRQAGDGALTLLAGDADVHAANARLEKKGSNPYNIGYWTNVNDTVSWGFMPAVGSSSNNSRGCVASARATSSRR